MLLLLSRPHVKNPRSIPEPEAVLSALRSLRERKLRAVRESIWDVAMDLFAAYGYDETTVEDIACAAGISLRSFFRFILIVLQQRNRGASMLEATTSLAHVIFVGFRPDSPVVNVEPNAAALATPCRKSA